MKKIISLILCLILITGAFSACSTVSEKESGKLKIVTTIFPVYDWVINILGEKSADAEVTMLLDSGVDLHSFQPGADDMAVISQCDLFVYVGGESDEWVDGVISSSGNKNLISLNLMEALGENRREEETVEGMMEEEEEEEGEAFDEHIWLSLKNAKIACRSICDSLCSADGENSETYKANFEAYLSKLEELDAKYTQTVESSSSHVLLFADRFPFLYMAKDYGIEYYAPFKGCSAESEASFETVAFLAKKVDELGLRNIIVLEGNDHKIAETVISNTKNKNQTVLELNSMQSVTADDVKQGADYLEIMQSNLSVLAEALH